MGLFVGWFTRGRWWFIAGFGVVLVASFGPWPPTVRFVGILLGVALMLVQLPVIYINERRRRDASDP